LARWHAVFAAAAYPECATAVPHTAFGAALPARVVLSRAATLAARRASHCPPRGSPPAGIAVMCDLLAGRVANPQAVRGVQPHPETVRRQATEYKVPRPPSLNKLDRTGANLATVYEQLKLHLTTNPLPAVLPTAAEQTIKRVADLLQMQAASRRDRSDGTVLGLDALRCRP
ncbi:GTP-binding protein, partial [Burkholderia pseudomallei]